MVHVVAAYKQGMGAEHMQSYVTPDVLLAEEARAPQRSHLKAGELVIDTLFGGLVQNAGIINDIILRGCGLVQDVKLVCERLTGAQEQCCCSPSLQSKPPQWLSILSPSSWMVTG